MENIKINCEICNKQFSCPSSWKFKPKECERCRLKQIHSIPQLLVNYIKKEIDIKPKLVLPDDKAAYTSRESLRNKIMALPTDTNKIIDICLRDRELFRLVNRLQKERNIKSKQKPMPCAAPKHIIGIYQGGAPGLGKRS